MKSVLMPTQNFDWDGFNKMQYKANISGYLIKLLLDVLFPLVTDMSLHYLSHFSSHLKRSSYSFMYTFLKNYD